MYRLAICTRSKRILLTATALILLFSTSNSTSAEETKSKKKNNDYLLLRTTLGDMLFELFNDAAPAHVAQIKKLTEMGAYTQVPFFYIYENFVAQIEMLEKLPNVSAEVRKQIKKIPGEFGKSNPNIHAAGVLSMARYDDPNSATTSFQVMLGPATNMDGHYTVFGRLIRGFPVLEAFGRVPVDDNLKPLKPIFLQSARMVSAKDIDSIELAMPKTDYSSQNWLMASGIMLIIIFSLIGFFFRHTFTLKTISGLFLFNVLVGAFALFTFLVPFIEKSQILATISFFALIGLFKVMNRLESP